MKILVTGGTGYIGSHTVIELLLAGHDVVILDNLSNSDAAVVARIQQITNISPRLIIGDICDLSMVRSIFAGEKIDAVIHFAAKKSVEESTKFPDFYYQTNVGGLATLCQAMREAGVNRFVFSSSAAVYGEPSVIPIAEESILNPLSPYGATKKTGEELLMWMAQSSGWSVTALRYFNPVGAHNTGQIGENPKVASNLLPIVVQVAGGKRQNLVVYGNDYPTKDGTCIRDYIHVVDLAKAHLAALEYTMGSLGFNTFNIGTGFGYSVLEVIASLVKVCGKNIPYTIGPRRLGDVSALVADTRLARTKLQWTSKLTLDDMTSSAWKWWQNSNF